MKRILTILALASSLAACSKNGDPSYYGTIKPTHPVDELIINASSEPQYMDPVMVSDSVSRTCTSGMFSRLTQSHPQTGVIIPDLAKSWDVSADRKEYTFHLREDAVWSDGEPITADDVVYSWKRLANSATAATYSQMADIIENARPFREKAIAISGLNPKENIKAILDKLQKVAPIKDLNMDAKNSLFYAFIDSDDGVKKNEYREKVLSEIQNGILGSNVTAKIADSDGMQLKAIDQHTVWVKLTRPAPYFLGMIEYMSFAPVPKHVLEKMKEQKKLDLWTRPENIVVSGPYILEKEEFKQYKIYKKNPKFYAASHVRINKVKALMIEDYQASTNAYKTGQHDWTPEASLPTDMVEELRKYKDYHHDPQLTIYYYIFNTRRKPFDDKRVSTALSLAIDRKTLVERVTKEGQIPTRDLVAYGIDGWTGAKSSIYDPEKAKKLLAEAGFPEGKGFPRMTLKFNTSEGHRKIAEAIQQMWKSTLGIQVEIANMEWRSLLDDQTRRNFDMVRFAWVADYMDPNTFMGTMLSESENNKSGWVNKTYDDLIFKSDNEPDQKKRFDLFVQAEKILADESPIAPIYSYTRSYTKKPFLKGFWPHYQDRHEWKYMWIDERWMKGVPADVNVPDEPWIE